MTWTLAGAMRSATMMMVAVMMNLGIASLAASADWNATFGALPFSKVVNSIGLLLDIIGAVLVWRYGLPEPISRKGEIRLVAEQKDDTEIASGRWYDRLAHLGVGLLIAGFLLHLVSNFV